MMSVSLIMPGYGKAFRERMPTKIAGHSAALIGLPQVPASRWDRLWQERLRDGCHSDDLSKAGQVGQNRCPSCGTDSQDQVNSHPAPTILVVEDEMIVALDLRHTLERMGYTVVGIACSGWEALQQATLTQPDVILMDIHLNDAMDGVEAATRIGTRLKTAIIYLTAQTDEATLQRARTSCPSDLLVKPFADSQLRAAVEAALDAPKDCE